MTDVQLAIVLAAAVMLIFGMGLLGIAATRGGSGDANVSGKLGAIDVRVTAVEQRLSSIETREAETAHDVRNIRAVVGTLPSKDAMHGVSRQVAEMAGKMEGVMEGVRATSRTVERLESFLLEASADALVAHKEKTTS